RLMQSSSASGVFEIEHRSPRGACGAGITRQKEHESSLIGTSGCGPWWAQPSLLLLDQAADEPPAVFLGLDKQAAGAEILLHKFEAGELGAVDLLLANGAFFFLTKSGIEQTREHRLSLGKLALLQELVRRAVRLIGAAEEEETVVLGAEIRQLRPHALVI